MSLKYRLVDALRKHKHNLAIQDDVSRITYADLDAKSERLAKYISSSLKSENKVGVISDKNVSTVVAFVACVRASVAYVPIDHGAPEGRRKDIINDSGIKFVIINEILVNVAEASSREPNETPAHAQYVLYTSGSTGKPKGVPISETNVSAFIDWACGALPLLSTDRVLNVSPLHFDLAVYDIYCSLLCGATLVLASENTCSFPSALAQQILKNKITVLYAVPTALNRLAKRSTFLKNAPKSLRRLMYAGEPLNKATYEKLRKALPETSIFNLYGPIETNVIAYKKIDKDALFVSNNIGKPCDHVDFLIVDENNLPVSDKGKGELAVSGKSVTLGYLNDEERNSKQFIKIIGKVFYKTGDIVSLNAEKEYLLHGRKDSMVKTRGFRVEIGEIEAQLQKLESVSEVIVVAVPDENISNKLIAFYIPVPGQVFDPFQALTYLTDYMLPGEFFSLDELPQTSTGKVDRNFLKKKALEGSRYG